MVWVWVWDWVWTVAEESGCVFLLLAPGLFALEPHCGSAVVLLHCSTARF